MRGCWFFFWFNREGVGLGTMILSPKVEKRRRADL